MKLKTLNDLKLLDRAALQKEADHSAVEGYKLKAEFVAGKTKKPNKMRDLKLYRARVLTFLRQKQIVELEEAEKSSKGKVKSV